MLADAWPEQAAATLAACAADEPNDKTRQAILDALASHEAPSCPATELTRQRVPAGGGHARGGCRAVVSVLTVIDAGYDPDGPWNANAGDPRDIMGYRLEVVVTDVLIRDVPDDVIAAVDAHAGRLGLSRSEYVRRRLAQDAAAQAAPVTEADLSKFAERFGDLADADVMSRAWQ